MSVATPYTTEFSLPADPTTNDPFFYGWRYVERQLPDGTSKFDQVPLTEWDVLHPQEDDFIVTNEAHNRDCAYLKVALQLVFKGREGIQIFADHRVDWEVPELYPHGPDVTVIDGLEEQWDPLIGTFPMRSWNGHPLLVMEVTSPSTRKGDLNEKVTEYHKAGVPYYVIVDRYETRGQVKVELIGYRTTPEGYVRMEQDADKGLWIPTVNLWFKLEEQKIFCWRSNGKRIAEPIEMEAEMQEERQRRESETLRADEESRRAKNESQRAEQERQRAEQERQRADDLERQLREAEEKISRLTAGN